MKDKIWIDTDLSVGMKRYERPGYSDVDDGYGILQLLLADEVEVTGVTAVFGNTRIDDAYRLCQQMVTEFARYPIEVYRGASGAIDLQSVATNRAVEAMAAALRAAPQKIMAIGPATNVGLLLLLYPELTDKIQEVVLVAGRRTERHYFAIGTQGRRARDLNFDLDNTAFEVLLQRGVPVTLCPFEISSKVWITETDLDWLAEQSMGCQWLAKESRPWLQQWKDAGADGFNPFDVLASHYLLRPQDIKYEELKAELAVHSDDTIGEDQQEVFKNYLLCTKQGQYPVRYCHDVVEDYHQRLLDTFRS